jgi:hypothetical protein
MLVIRWQQVFLKGLAKSATVDWTLL